MFNLQVIVVFEESNLDELGSKVKKQRRSEMDANGNKNTEDKIKSAVNMLNPNTSNLCVGDNLNYKQLTQVLGIKYLGGTAKTAQLKALLSFIDYEKKGTRFLIKEIYDAETAKDKLQEHSDRMRELKRSNCRYVDYIEGILLHEIESTGLNVLTMTPNKLYRLFGMANANFFYKNEECTTDKEFVADRNMFIRSMVPEAPKKDITDFYIRSYDKFRRTLLDGLESLRKKRLIDYKIEWIIVTCAEKSFAASDKQYEIIELAEHRALKKMGLDKIEHVYLANRTKDFRTRVNRLIENMGWDYYYKAIHITYIGEPIITDKSFYESKQAAQQMKKELNDLLIQFLNNKAEKVVLDEWNEPRNNTAVQKQLIESLLRI
jgi:hypothetical protein